jgi:hypothetical protein
LQSIAYSQNWYAEFEDSRVDVWRIGVVHGIRSSRQDNSFGFPG